jgi:hypothetical protein
MSLELWLALIGVVLALLAFPFGIVVSRYYYRRSDKKRVPTFVIQKVTALSDPSLTKSAPNLTVSCCGVPVGKEGISEAKIYFWNSGALAMRREDVLRPYTVTLPVPIISHSVTKINREVTQLKVEQTAETQVILDFSVLEEGDGCTLSIVYDGPAKTSIDFSGASLDAPKPKVLPPHPFYSLSKSKRYLRTYGLLPILLLFLAVVIGALFGAFAGLSFLLKKIIGEVAAKIVMTTILGLFAGGYFLWLIFSAIWPEIRRLNAPYLPPDVKE